MEISGTDLMKTYRPVLAIMVYEAGTKTVYYTPDNNYYLESHRVSDDGQILEGKPLLQETLDGIVDVFFDERKSRTDLRGYIPENILSYSSMPGGKYKLVWYRPAEERVLHFSEKLLIPSGKSCVPAMLYVSDGKELSVFALSTNSRPSQKTKLFKAPFHNIYQDGKVCLGNAKVKKPTATYEALMKYWEDLFWLSEFSHLNGSNNPTKTNINTLWKQMIKSKGTMKWKNAELNSMNKTLLNFL